MHIDFVRTGGFAGIRLAASVETGQLPLEQALWLEKMVADAGFFGLSPTIGPPSPVPDRFEYQVNISSAVQEHSGVVNESVVPERLRPLLDYLVTLALSNTDR
jgi:hypothetical protein